MPEVSPTKYRVEASWWDVPHLDDKTKQALLDSTPEYLREARSRGIPTVGEGKVFTFPEEMIRVQPFICPADWPGIAGIDFGWAHPSAVALCRVDPDSKTIYVTHGFKGQKHTPIMMWEACRAWVEGYPCAWPHDGLNETQAGGGIALKTQFQQVGFKLLPTHAQMPSDKPEGRGPTSLDASIVLMTQLFQMGKLKVFASVDQFWPEYRLYHAKNGKIVKLNDDLISAIRYAVMMVRYARTKITVAQVMADLFGVLDPETGY